MKTTFIKIIFLSSFTSMMLFGCKKDETIVVAKEGTSPTLSSSVSSVVLIEENAAKDAIALSWTASDFGYTAGVKYSLQFDKKGGDFSAPVVKEVEALKKTFTVVELNDVASALKLETGIAADVQVRVMAKIANAFSSAVSTPITLSVNPYSGKPKELFLVGGSTIVDWKEANALAFKSLGDGKFESYQYLVASGGGFKILPKVASWNGDMGMKKGEPGVLAESDEDNIPVAADGFYRIYLGMTGAKSGTYSVTPMEWGIVGDATAGDWSKDTPMTLKSATKENYTWTITANLVGGKAMKFRANNNWDFNFGDTGVDGKLEAGGDNIAVSASGNYTITLTLAPAGYTYTMVKN